MDKKSMPKLQRRLMGNSYEKSPEDEAIAGLTISDYEALCKACALQPNPDTSKTKRGKNLILK